MKKRTKRLLIITSVLLVVLVTAGVLCVRYMMSQPLYHPGMVRAGENLRAPLTPPPQPQEPDVWQVEEDVQLYNFSVGSGSRMLFIHGGPGFPTHRVPAGLKLLAAEHEIHFYDQRGCGRSTKPFDRFTSRNFYENMVALDRTLGIGAQIADIERIRRILQQEKLTLIGHSFGGFLASLYAAEFPDRVAAMVLVAPADLIVFPPSSGGLFEVMRERLPANMHEDYTRFVDEYTDFSNVFAKSEQELAALNREFGRYFLLATGDEPGTQLEELTAMGNGGWMVTAMYLGLGKRHDYGDALRAVHVPTLIVHGDRDVVPRSVSQQYAEVLGNAKLEVITGAAHFVMEESPVEFSDVVGAFLRGCGMD